MLKEQKELLFKDLCGRLPYGVMVREDTIIYDDKNTTSYRIKKLNYVLIGKGFLRIKGFTHDYEYIYRPYLFPLSSMTEEQMEELKELCDMYTPDDDYHPYAYKGIKVLYKHVLDNNYEFNFNTDVIDWFNKNHFDYRGLIPMGLAIDATGKNIY